MANANCRSCGAEVLFVRHVETGKRMPLEKMPAEDARGMFVLTHLDGSLYYMAAKGHVYRSHYATCPDADDWRKS